MNILKQFIKKRRLSRLAITSCSIGVLLFFLSGIINPASAEGHETVAGEGFWLWSFLGRLHPMIVHFPVGLLYIALFFEFISWKRASLQLRNGVPLLIATGAISSVIAVVLGLLLSNTETYGSNVLQVHQWSGIATMILACATYYLYLKKQRKFSIILLTATVLGVTVAGHYGSELTHGEDYLSSVLPFGKDAGAGTDSSFIFAGIKGPLDSSQRQELNLQVRTILAHNCYSCHGETKVKGELRLDSKQYIFKGGKNGSILTPGHPDKSEIIRRISLSRRDKEAMPSKGKGLTATEIATLTLWIKQGAPWPDGPERSLFRVAAMAPRLPAVPPATGNLTSPVDLFVNNYFKQHKISWVKPVEDRIYLRRVYMDIIGLVPPPDSMDAFVKDTRPDKRTLMVQHLLNRNDDYTQQWLSFWNDALRNDYSGTGYITGGRFGITKWLYTSLKENKPYNRFVSELINPDKQSDGFIKGIQWRGTINSSQRTEMQAAQNVSQVFFGVNLKCASCHNSFVSDWKLDDAYAFANVFSDSTLEINRCDKPTGKMAGRRILFKELGNINPDAPRKERLKQLADSLVQPRNGRLYRTFVNRMWAQLMGRGIVEPVDVMDNEPWSQDLLDWLAYDFVTSGYDIKKLMYTILTSQIYQQPSVTVKEPGLLTTKDFVFKGMVTRRLTAEEFTDAVGQVLAPVYADSMIVFNLMPENIKPNIPFARASLVKNDAFLTALGRPNRETVSTSRTSQASLLQALELTNGAQFNQALHKAAIKWKEKYKDPLTMTREVYRAAIGRLPSKEEEKVALTALGSAPSIDAVQDFLWAIALHPEFQLIY
ncbi:DUF1549 domain-containing protein [Ferruginibacter paludis]|uniref:DUF1549 domain-containing protein n=1 Tax=Ferruginibacter paludis TaxID=1310417 RepID=UPI0025B39393|nr:DUF1549 domain-containing protein [Ferruginibacter paludis]MDN3659231.1 DUF1549 domain-containing protein [Ferruginibacter paludis]